MMKDVRLLAHYESLVRPHLVPIPSHVRMGDRKDEPATVTKHPAELAKCSAEILHMLESLATDNGVEGAVIELQVAIQVPFHESNAGEPPLRHGKHRWREIQTNDFHPVGVERRGVTTSTTSSVEDLLSSA